MRPLSLCWPDCRPCFGFPLPFSPVALLPSDQPFPHPHPRQRAAGKCCTRLFVCACAPYPSRRSSVLYVVARSSLQTHDPSAPERGVRSCLGGCDGAKANETVSPRRSDGEWVTLARPAQACDGSDALDVTYRWRFAHPLREFRLLPQLLQ